MAVLEMPPPIHDPLDTSEGNKALMREWFRRTNAILKSFIRDGVVVGAGNSWSVQVPLASPSGLEYTSGDLRIDIDNAILQIATAGLGFSKAAINTVLSGPGSGSSDTPTFRSLVDADIPAAIARDSEVTSAIAALSAVYQPLDSDLTSIAALSTTSFGRAFLTLADVAATYTALNLAAGAYTPTLTKVGNLDAVTSYEAQYMRVGATVTVSGKFDADPTAAGSTKVGISLPVASNIGAAEDVAGVAHAIAIAGQGAGILGDATNDRAQAEWIAVDTTNQTMAYSFAYAVI